MDELINKLVAEYRAGHLTWHDIQDLVEGYCIKQAGGFKEYSKTPIRERLATEDKILRKIESEIYQR